MVLSTYKFALLQFSVRFCNFCVKGLKTFDFKEEIMK